jgi:hypothetical protein
MDNTSSINTDTSQVDRIDWKIALIVLLVCIILIFTSLGTFASEFISDVLYSTGWFIGKSSDLVAKTSETSIDIANGAVHNGSELLIKASQRGGDWKPLSIGAPNYHETAKHDENPENKDTHQPHKEPEPDKTENPIQKPIASGKSNWCLVGEYQGKRGCIALSDSDKCMSGQIFPSQQACLNPTFSQNVLPNMTTPMGIPPRVDLTALPNTTPSYDQQQYAENQIKNVPRDK